MFPLRKSRDVNFEEFTAQAGCVLEAQLSQDTESPPLLTVHSGPNNVENVLWSSDPWIVFMFFILCSYYFLCAKVAGRDQRTNYGLYALLSLYVSEGSNSGSQAWQQAPTPTEPSRQPLSIMFKRSVLRLCVTDVEGEVRKQGNRTL